MLIVINIANCSASVVAGVLAHLSFDIFAYYDSKFPLFTPFYNHQISFPNADWIYFEIVAVTVIGITTIFARKRSLKVVSN